MKHNNINIVVAALLLCGAAGASAQVRPAYLYPAQSKGGTQLGDTPAFGSWWVGTGVGYDDNLFLTEHNERSSGFYVISPGLRIDARSPNSVLQFSHQIQVGRYWTSHNDDYIDTTTLAQADMAFSNRSFGRIGMSYIAAHDPRGSTDRAISSRPDEYKIFSPGATYAFGAPGAQGRVELYYTYMNKRYDNNRDITRFSDRDQQDYGTALYVRVAPKTYVLGEVRQTDIDYKITSPFSGQERRYYAGVTWEATALTTGTLKYGRLKRTFDSPTPSASTASWEGVVVWAPRTYSVLEFTTSRQTNESSGQGRFIITELYQLGWNHQWSSYMTSGVTARWQRDEYQGFDRTDDTRSLGFRVGYKFRPWLTLGAEYTHTNRDSNLSNDYNKNFYLLSATIAP
jgi:hypothetical protein